MLIFEQNISSEDFKFKSDTSTTNFLVAFSGLYPYEKSKDLDSLLFQLGVSKPNTRRIDAEKLFTLNGKYCLDADNQSSKNSFESTIILPKTFKSKKESFQFFQNVFVTSLSAIVDNICVITVIDADKLISFLKLR